MRRASRRRAILLLVVAALVSVALWQSRREQAAANGSLLSLSPAAIKHIELRMQGTRESYRRHDDGHWWRDDGVPSRGDDGRLDELAAIAAAPVADWRPASAYQADKIGLAAPAISLALDEQHLDFGDTSATAPLRYVRVGSRIALIPLSYTPRPAVAAP